MPELSRYCTRDGRQPFTEWLSSIRDKPLKASLLMRLRRVEAGNFGDCKPVGDGLIELRLHQGPGYRIYLGQHGSELVILLCGGNKASQPADIRLAKCLWMDWKERRHEKI